MATKLHSYRCDPELVEAARLALAKQGRTLTDAILEKFAEVVAESHKPPRKRAKAG